MLAQLDVLALAVLERVDEHALLVRRAIGRSAMSTTCCSALSGSPRCRTSSSASSPVRLRRGPSAVSSTSTVAVDAERGDDAVQEIDDRCGVGIGCGIGRLFEFSRAAASVLPPPTRFIRRSAAGRGRTVRIVRRADQVVRRVLLADRPDVADQPVERHARRMPEEHEREERPA